MKDSGVTMTEERKGYNGWANYETWAMALWIDNDEGSYSHSREIVKEARDYSLANEYRLPENLAADHLKEWMEEAMCEWEPESASVFTDLLHAAFSEVDWYEIAENFLSEVE